MQMQQIHQKTAAWGSRKTKNAQKEGKGIRDVGTAGFHASVLPISMATPNTEQSSTEKIRVMMRRDDEVDVVEEMAMLVVVAAVDGRF
ncbi:hypothetical protein TEQG_08824 [Trichophyton equinum CBS 127.97]|uniref:Uncharacterized protein n=1 Tax=Trichophyton equinum (strain ATCC MYA-4606 / CBS 127.97) TaxID=559882 RepID=F2Q490_TRIEC|nr:hypothetical protein TEQG_08824 [Trichophyton equinum CBS 127.97]